MVAGTPERQQRGLMYRSSLADDEGMLFVYDLPGRYSFWMKNMRFSLDIIWITDALEVGQIMRHVPPCPAVGRCSPFAPREPVQFVLEVPAGFADEHNISEGDTVTIVNSHEVH